MVIILLNLILSLNLVILNRGGQMGGITALYFNGAVCDFQQLPLPNETEKIQKWYDFLNRKNVKSFFMKILKKI